MIKPQSFPQNSGQTNTRRATIVRMSKLGVAGIALALGVTAAGATAAVAANDSKAPHCKVLSTRTEVRNVTGVVISTNPTRYGSGSQSRTVTTSKCKGQQVVTYSTWTRTP